MFTFMFMLAARVRSAEVEAKAELWVATDVDRGYGGERVVEVPWPRIVVAKSPEQKQKIGPHVAKFKRVCVCVCV